MNPTAYLKRVARHADPKHKIRVEYTRLARIVGVRVKDWPLTIRHSRKYPKETSGTCWGSGRITVTIGVDATKAQIAALLLHELAHAAAPRKVHHGSEWRAIFCDAAHEAFGVTVAGDIGCAAKLHDAMIEAIAKATGSE